MKEDALPGAVFQVKLTVDGGQPGHKGRCPTFTYTVRDLQGNVLGRQLSPQKPRAAGRHSAATAGRAFYDTDGRLWLAEAYEVAQSGRSRADY